MISFIIPLFNHLAETKAMLVSLRASLPAGVDYEIVLVDDFSTDGTREWLAGLDDPRFKKILNPQNMGYAATNNRGVRAASGEILAFLNNDLLLAPGWLEPMLAVLQSPLLKAGMVGNVQYQMHEGVVDHAGVQLNYRAQFEHIRTLPENGPGYARMLAVTGACVLMQADDFKQAGGFDEAFVNGCEDIDLCLRIRQAGKHIYLAYESRIYHHVSLSRNRQSLRNESNSRHLFGLWRTEIKRQLSLRWAAMLQDSGDEYQSYLDGELSRPFAATPHLASLVIAEAMILREEFRWARDLGEANHQGNLARRCRAQGLRYVARGHYEPLANCFEIMVEGVRSARNFYVCGRARKGFGKDTMAMSIDVNGIQHKTIPLENSNINVGIIDPIMLSGICNVFRVQVGDLDPARDSVTSAASTAIILTHIVIDDQRIEFDHNFRGCGVGLEDAGSGEFNTAIVARTRDGAKDD